MNEYMVVWRRWNDFKGRSRRREFWMFALVHFGVSLALAVLATVLALLLGGSDMNSPMALLALVPVYAYALAAFVPQLAVTVRRLHDTGKSGWWALLYLVPFVGVFAVLVLAALETEGENRWGPPAKALGASA